jgi:integrase
MAIHKLAANFVETAREKGLYNDGGGLYAQVGEGGKARSWVFRFTSPVTGRKREMGLGSFDTIGLAQARDEARKCREQVKSDIDPINAREDAALAQRLEAAKRITFAACFEEWIQLQDWTPRTRYNITRPFESYVLPKLGNIPVSAITATLIEQDVMDPIWEKIPVQAREVLRNLKAIFDWATDAQDYRTGANPVHRVQARLKPFSRIHTVKHHRALPYEEMGAFMAQLRNYISGGRRPERPLSSYVLEFIILTACRTHQARELRWKPDLNPTTKVWLCERHKTVKKTKEPLIIPLSDAAWGIIETMRELQDRDGLASDYVFAHTFEGNPYYKVKRKRWRGEHLKATTVRLLLSESLKRPDLTVHGFRTTFRSWAGEMGWPFEDSEMALGHTVGNQVQQIYSRQMTRIGPRRKLMEAWAEHCNRTEPLDAKVIPIMKQTIA